MAEKKPYNIFVWIILGLLIVGLMGFGATGLSGNVRTVATVGEKEVSVSAYANEIRRQINSFEAQMGRPIPFGEARELGLDQLAISTLLRQRTLDNEAAQMGLSIGDERVANEVINTPAFQGANGFDRALYGDLLDQNGLTERQYETRMREEAARTLLQLSIVTGLPRPDAYADTLVQFVEERRDFSFATLGPDALTAPIPEPSADDLRAYYDANPEDFTTREIRKITYVALTPDMIQDEIEIDEDQLRELYDQRIDEYVIPERRLVERLPFATEDAALEAAAAISAGETDFEALVAARGLDLSAVDLGDVSREDLRSAGDAVFDAQVGDVVGPVTTSLGPALFRVNAVLAADETPFEEAIPDLRVELAGARARRIIDDRRLGIEDLLAGGARLEDIAEQTEMEIGTLDWTDATQDGLAAYANFRDAAATTEPGDFPDLLELEDGGIFTLRVDDIQSPTLRPLDEVEAEVRAAWTDAATADALLEQAAEIAGRLSTRESWEDVGLRPMVETNETRRGFIEGTPPGALQDTVFALEGPGQARAVPGQSGQVIVVQLDAIADPDPEDPQVIATRDQLAESAVNGIAQDIFDLYSRRLQERTDVQIDQAAINAVNAGLQ